MCFRGALLQNLGPPLPYERFKQCDGGPHPIFKDIPWRNFIREVDPSFKKTVQPPAEFSFEHGQAAQFSFLYIWKCFPIFKPKCPLPFGPHHGMVLEEVIDAG